MATASWNEGIPGSFVLWILQRLFRIRPILSKKPPLQRNPPCFAPKFLGGYYGIYGRAAEIFGGFDVIYHRKPIKNDVLNVLEPKFFARLRRAMFFLVNLYKSRAAGARKNLAQTPTFKEPPPLFRSKKQQGGVSLKE